MVSADTLLIYTDEKPPFTVHTNASDKQICAVIKIKKINLLSSSQEY